MDGDAVSISSIAKLLASPHEPTRDRAVRSLSAWLSSNPAASVSDADLLKAWKALFYSVWHCDGAAAQSALAARLAAVLPSLPPPLAARFLAAALSTLRREWPGIDLLRLDKFYLLLRRLLRYALLLLNAHGWDRSISAEITAILSEKAALLSADNYGSAQGVSYHLAEVYLDELREFLPLSLKTLEILFNPFVTVLENSQDKVLVNKVNSNIFERLLENGSKLLSALRSGVGMEVSEEVQKFGKVGLLLGFSIKFFESASNRETIQGNRKVLFRLHEGFVKLEKDLEVSGVEISLPELESGRLEKLGIVENVGQVDEDVGNGGTVGQGDEDVGNGGAGSDEKPSKKRKKAKKALVSETLEEGGMDVGSDGGVLDDMKKKKKKKKKKEKNKGKKALNSVNKISKTKKKNFKLVSESVVAKLVSETDSVVNSGESINREVKGADCSINFDETTISNLQKQFEKVAAEDDMANGGTNSCSDQITSIVTIPKKRKRSMSSHREAKVGSIDASGGSIAEKSGEKTIKKVKFSMKNNIVWKPQTPLPPQSLRLPPSAMPRGSALKKGVPPGPIIEAPLTITKVKVKANSVKKARKGRKRVSPAIKRLRKLQSISV